MPEKQTKQPRICYALLPSEMADPSKTHVTPIVITEGESGYNVTNWSWDKESAEQACDAKNLAMGISPAEACRMVLASMFPKGSSRPKPANRQDQIKMIEEAWDAVVTALDGNHNAAANYLLEHVKEERDHRSSREGYGLGAPLAAKLMAVKNLAQYLDGKELPEIRDYLDIRKSLFTAAALSIKYHSQLMEALEPFGLETLRSLDYAALVKTKGSK